MYHLRNQDVILDRLDKALHPPRRRWRTLSLLIFVLLMLFVSKAASIEQWYAQPSRAALHTGETGTTTPVVVRTLGALP